MIADRGLPSVLQAFGPLSRQSRERMVISQEETKLGGDPIEKRLIFNMAAAQTKHQAGGPHIDSMNTLLPMKRPAN